ncbi:hypothetical protein [Segnochrobactrum spirostomi]|uniref:hypothetical protein n=1 Tax=Segnochrobactrum spirostomi TaxID=2608987 RepID=UPI001FEB199C|nr:hypothetical protein [Segnochrobactrum spirostomi]
MPELHGQLVILLRPAVHIEGALAENERVLVEIVVLGVVEKYFSNKAMKTVLVRLYFDAVFIRNSTNDCPIALERIRIGKLARIQEDFVLSVVNVVHGEALAQRNVKGNRRAPEATPQRDISGKPPAHKDFTFSGAPAGPGCSFSLVGSLRVRAAAGSGTKLGARDYRCVSTIRRSVGSAAANREARCSSDANS